LKAVSKATPVAGVQRTAKGAPQLGGKSVATKPTVHRHASSPFAKTSASQSVSSAAKSVSVPSGDSRSAQKRANGHAGNGLNEALKAFETALGVFNRGDFVAARASFQKIVEHYGGHTEIIARTQMYLTVCSRRTQSASSAPRSADSLYDRGVVEINRGQYDAAIALLEKALKSQPAKTGYVLYALAVAQVRSGRVDEGLANLERAIEAHGVCRSQARQDPDLAAIWGLNRFQEIVGDPYEMW